MRSPSTTTPVVARREDTRTDGAMTGGERAVLHHWLDPYRDPATTLPSYGPASSSNNCS